MPVQIRKWWIRRKDKENKKQSGQQDPTPKNTTPAPWTRSIVPKR
jgi:hypothetical protein